MEILLFTSIEQWIPDSRTLWVRHAILQNESNVETLVLKVSPQAAQKSGCEELCFFIFCALLCERSAKRDIWHILLHNDRI